MIRGPGWPSTGGAPLTAEVFLGFRAQLRGSACILSAAPFTYLLAVVESTATLPMQHLIIVPRLAEPAHHHQQQQRHIPPSPKASFVAPSQSKKQILPEASTPESSFPRIERLSIIRQSMPCRQPLTLAHCEMRSIPPPVGSLSPYLASQPFCASRYCTY